MNKDLIEKFEKALLEEKTLLEKELAGVAQRNPSNPADWVPTTGDKDQSSADENVTADSFENLENNMGVTTNLENRLTDVNNALEKIKSGNYGICEKGEEEIELDRLEVNPAARTCKEHM